MLENYSKILIIRFSSFGDIVLTFPLINLLRRKYPKCKIHFLTLAKYSGLVNLHTEVNKVWILKEEQDPYEFRAVIADEDYDIILDLHKNYRSRIISSFQDTNVRAVVKETFKKLLLVEFKINKFKEIIPVYKKYILTLKNYFGDPSDYNFTASELKLSKERVIKDKYVVIAPSSRHFSKTYPIEHFVRYISRLKIQPVITGDSIPKDLHTCDYIERNTSNTINLCGKLDYEQLANLLYHSEFVVCNDSGVLHLAEALGKKVIALFGSTVKEFGFYPQLKDSIVFENEGLPCRPCTHIGLPGCPKEHFLCMREISPEKLPIA